MRHRTATRYRFLHMDGLESYSAQRLAVRLNGTKKGGRYEMGHTLAPFNAQLHARGRQPDCGTNPSQAWPRLLFRPNIVGSVRILCSLTVRIKVIHRRLTFELAEKCYGGREVLMAKSIRRKYDVGRPVLAKHLHESVRHEREPSQT